jgi:hypothetical protein
LAADWELTRARKPLRRHSLLEQLVRSAALAHRSLDTLPKSFGIIASPPPNVRGIRRCAEGYPTPRHLISESETPLQNAHVDWHHVRNPLHRHSRT